MNNSEKHFVFDHLCKNIQLMYINFMMNFVVTSI